MQWIDVGHANGLLQSPCGEGAPLNGSIRGDHPDMAWVYIYANTNYPSAMEVHGVRLVLAPVEGWPNEFISFKAYYSADQSNPCSLADVVVYESDWGQTLESPQEILFLFAEPIKTELFAGCDRGWGNNTSDSLEIEIRQGTYAKYNEFRWEIVSVEALVEAGDFWTSNVGTVEVAI